MLTDHIVNQRKNSRIDECKSCVSHICIRFSNFPIFCYHQQAFAFSKILYFDNSNENDLRESLCVANNMCVGGCLCKFQRQRQISDGMSQTKLLSSASTLHIHIFKFPIRRKKINNNLHIYIVLHVLHVDVLTSVFDVFVFYDNGIQFGILNYASNMCG